MTITTKQQGLDFFENAYDIQSVDGVLFNLPNQKILSNIINKEVTTVKNLYNLKEIDSTKLIESMIDLENIFKNKCN